MMSGRPSPLTSAILTPLSLKLFEGGLMNGTGIVQDALSVQPLPLLSQTRLCQTKLLVPGSHSYAENRTSVRPSPLTSASLVPTSCQVLSSNNSGIVQEELSVQPPS